MADLFLAQNTQRLIAQTLWIAQILKRWLLVAKKVSYKFPNDIPLQMSTLRVVNGRFIFRQNTQTAIAWTPHPKKKKKKNLHINTHPCQFMAQNSEIWGGRKNFWTFSQKSALFGPANNQSVTYLKIPTKVFRVPSSTPMDWFLMKSVNAKYPLSCHKCVKKWTLCTQSPARPPKCVTHPQK